MTTRFRLIICALICCFSFGIRAQDSLIIDNNELQYQQSKRPVFGISVFSRIQSKKQKQNWLPGIYSNSEFSEFNNVGYEIFIGLRNRWSFGIDYENLSQSFHVFEKEIVHNGHALFFSSTQEYGDRYKMEQAISGPGVWLSYKLNSLAQEKRIAYQVSSKLKMQYLLIKKKENIEMQGNYKYVNTTLSSHYTYDVDQFEKKSNFNAFLIQVGLKGDLILSKHFSLILPELNFQFGGPNIKHEGSTYMSTHDYDEFIINPYDLKLMRLTILFGLSLHIQ